MALISSSRRRLFTTWTIQVTLLYYTSSIDHASASHPVLANKLATRLFIEPKTCKSGNESLDVQSSNSDYNDHLYTCVERLEGYQRSKVLVSGGAGFVGSHLVDSLMLDGHEVVVCDNFFTGRRANIEHWLKHPNFKLIEHDVTLPIAGLTVDQIYHLASPASPAHYLDNPIETIKTNTIGTINLLDLASRYNARLVLASTSEVYGDPEIHPQSESYWGNTNPVGPRSCYDESKRLGESLAVAYKTKLNVSIGIARIFNTYGPRMLVDDGRVVSNFVSQTIQGGPITVYGSGLQTRSFQYVSDLVEGLRKLMAKSHVFGPVNLGNPEEMTIIELAQRIKTLLPNSTSQLVFKPLPIDDPRRRRPDINRALNLLSWQPRVSLNVGLKRTIDYFEQELSTNLKRAGLRD